MKHKAFKSKRELIITPVRVEGITFALSADGSFPKRIKVLNWGENPNWYGLTVRVGRQLVEAMSSDVYPWQKVALDFEHNTLPGTRAYKESSEPRSVAGFGSVEVVENDGVYLCMEKWTPEGLRAASNFCDVSASPALDKFGNVTSIKSVALCRNGAVPEMDFCEVALSVDADVFAVVTGNTKKENPMKELWRKFIAKVQGKTPEEVADSDVEAAVKLAGEGDGTAAASADPAVAPLSADALGTMVRSELDAALKPIQEQVKGLNADLNQVKGEGVARTKQGVIDEARRAGKAVTMPEAAVAALSVEQLQEHVQGLAVTIPVDQRTPKHVQESGSSEGISEQDRQIALNCGMDPEEVFGSEKQAD